MADTVRFGAFEFNPETRELRKHGLRIRVPDQSLEILATLVECPGETVTRERIRSLLWPNGTVVGFERSINAAVGRLREALGDTAGKACFIERVPRRGYRFVAPLERLPRTQRRPGHDGLAGMVLLHYRLLEKAGSGSMGEVWKAEDTKLGRTVALKFVPERFAGDPDALEAFRQEARHAALLNHPNICTIHGLEEDNGRRFLVLEYIAGRPLTDLLAGAPLPARQIVEIGIQACEALAAHLNGVIHRDIKPANLMLTAEGRLKLTDFGIATGSPANCAAHTPAGTLGYVSPEQVRGEAVDARSDLFSLGVVLYELATARRPFGGDDPSAMVQAVLTQDPPPPRALNPALPVELERVILRALEKDLAARLQSAMEMAGALRRIEPAPVSRFSRRAVFAAAGMAVAAMAGWQWMRPSPRLAERDAIVVADFDNRTGDEVFDGALRQALLSQVGQSPYLSIVSEDRIRSTLRSMGRSSADRLAAGIAREVCQRAGAKAVLAGSIRSLGTRYFVGLDAVGCAGGEVLASEYMEVESRERVLAALGQTASKLRRRLGESLASTRKLDALAEVTTPSLDALKAYSLALDERSRGNDPVPLLRRAIELDPEFAAAYFMLARVQFTRGQELEGEASISRAFAVRGRASERERLAIEDFYHKIATGNAVQAIAVGTLASQLYPNDAATWEGMVLPYCNLGDYDKALQAARRAVEAAPRDGGGYFDLAAVLITVGRTGEARALLDNARAQGIDSESFLFHRYLLATLDGDLAAMEREAGDARGKPLERRLAMLQAQTAGYFGQLARAREVVWQAAARWPSSAPELMATLALMDAAFGLETEAKTLARAALRHKQSRRAHITSALALALTGEPEAESILDDLLRRYPSNTLIVGGWKPAVLGAIALSRGDARAAAEAAESPLPNRFAIPRYVRGLACLKMGLAPQAAAEFRKILGWKPTLFAGAWQYGAAFLYPAAQLGLARALGMDGLIEESRKIYDAFLAGWSRADSDIPILIRARAERAALPPGTPRAAPYPLYGRGAVGLRK